MYIYIYTYIFFPGGEKDAHGVLRANRPFQRGFLAEAVLGAKTQAPVRDAAWSAAGEVLAGSADGSARVWRRVAGMVDQTGVVLFVASL